MQMEMSSYCHQIKRLFDEKGESCGSSLKHIVNVLGFVSDLGFFWYHIIGRFLWHQNDH